MGNLDFLIRGEKKLPRSTSAKIHNPIAGLIEGSFASEKSQNVFLRKVIADPENITGLAQAISPPALHPLIRRWAGMPTSSAGHMEKTLFIDTETTGLAGGTGTYAFLVGLGYFEKDQFAVEQIFMQDPAGEKELLALLADRLSGFDMLVSFNGKSYDIPLLDNRFIYNAHPFQIRELLHLDLLPLSRRLWKSSLPGCALLQLEEHILHTGRDLSSDIPGRDIPQMYFDFLRSGDASQLVNVFYHNVIDIASMVLLMDRISEILEQPIIDSPQHQAKLTSVARFYYDMDEADRAERVYRFCLKNDLHISESRRELSFLLKRAGDWDKAAELWQMSADQGETYAHIELAKAAEHRLKDFALARQLTLSAIEIEEAAEFPDDIAIAALHHRLRRLERKISSPQS